MGYCKCLQSIKTLAEKVLTLQCCFFPEACGQGWKGSRQEQVEKDRRDCIALWRAWRGMASIIDVDGGWVHCKLLIIVMR